MELVVKSYEVEYPFCISLRFAAPSRRALETPAPPCVTNLCLHIVSLYIFFFFLAVRREADKLIGRKVISSSCGCALHAQVSLGAPQGSQYFGSAWATHLEPGWINIGAGTDWPVIPRLFWVYSTGLRQRLFQCEVNGRNGKKKPEAWRGFSVGTCRKYVCCRAFMRMFFNCQASYEYPSLSSL